MPNWMECAVQIIGPTDEIARFRTAHIGNDRNDELQLDFDSIITMPPELRDTNATPSDAFVWALGGELYASRNLSRRLGYEMADATPLDLAWVRELGIISREGLLNWAEVNRPDKLAGREARDGSRTCYRLPELVPLAVRQLGMQVGLRRICVAVG